MVCEFCGEEFDGKPVRQAGQVFCSIECADMAAEVGTDDEEYYEEDDLDLSPTDEDELY